MRDETEQPAIAGVPPQILQKMMRHSDINLTMRFYVHLELSDKAAALSKLPPIKTLKPKQLKTGTADVPEKLTGNLTENPLKITQNTAKYSKGEIGKAKDVRTVTPCKQKDLPVKNTMRVLGLEPKTYGLKGRCSTN